MYLNYDSLNLSPVRGKHFYWIKALFSVCDDTKPSHPVRLLAKALLAIPVKQTKKSMECFLNYAFAFL